MHEQILRFAGPTSLAKTTTIHYCRTTEEGLHGSDAFAEASRITEEEQVILDERTTIDSGIYMDDSGNTINAQKLLASGKLITLRPHTPFIHFPKHNHDYVEIVYMCAGETTHIVNGNAIRLHSRELLFMNQSATHEILEVGEQDLAVNFIVLPEFFSSVLPLLQKTGSKRKICQTTFCS